MIAFYAFRKFRLRSVLALSILALGLLAEAALGVALVLGAYSVMKSILF